MVRLFGRKMGGESDSAIFFPALIVRHSAEKRFQFSLSQLLGALTWFCVAIAIWSRSPISSFNFAIWTWDLGDWLISVAGAAAMAGAIGALFGRPIRFAACAFVLIAFSALAANWCRGLNRAILFEQAHEQELREIDDAESRRDSTGNSKP